MTNPDFDANDDDDFEPDEPQNPNLRNLRQKAKKYDAAEADLQALRRENAFLKAGIPDTPHGKLLQKAYDGEPTPEAIRAFAVEHGVIDATDDIPADELAAMNRADAASKGGGYTPPRAPDMNAALRAATGRQ